MRSRLLLVAGVLALAAPLMAIPAVHAAAAGNVAARSQSDGKQPWKPTAGGWFNDPWGDSASQFRIERQIADAIRHARKGSYIRIAVYSFDRVNMAKLLINAHHRGVHVQVLHNDHQYTTAMKMLKHDLGTNRGKKSWDYTCKTGCRSEQGVLHDKIYLFEHTGGAKDVVMTGSANLTGNATRHQFNDLLIKNDVPQLYDRLFSLFRELKKDRTAKPLYEHDDLGAFETWVMPHPHTTMENDPVMQILRPVQCQGATGGTGTAGRTKIRVSMHAWNGTRGTYIARRLRNLYAQGCDVRVLWALGGSEMKRTIGMQTPRGTVPRHTDGYNTDCDELQEVDMYSHQKYLTISGHYGHDTASSNIYTGSSNYTHSGLVGDELILRAAGAHLVNQWNRNFDFIWDHRSRPVGDSPGPSFNPTPPVCETPAAKRVATTRGLSYSGRFWEGD